METLSIELPRNWKWVKFGDIASERAIGLVRSSKEQSFLHPYPYIKMDSICLDGSLDLSSVTKVEATEPEVNRYSLRRGDFLFNTRNSHELVGKTAIFNLQEDGWLYNNNIMRVRFISDVDPTYINLAFHTSIVQRQLESLKRKTTSVCAIYDSQLINIKIPLPPIAQQKRIAAILDKADELRSLRRRALEQLDAIAQSMFLEIHTQGKKLAQDFSLSDIAEPTRNSFVNGPFGSDLLTSELQGSGIPVIYIRDIRDGKYQRISTVFVTEQKAHDLAFCSVRNGDVLVSKVGDPPGIAAIYPANESPGIVTQDVIRIRPDLSKAHPMYIAAYLNSSIGRWKIAGITVRSTRSRFSLGDFKRLQIALPSLDIQLKFAGSMSPL